MGLFSTRCKNECIASYTGVAKAKMELKLCTYYPRLKDLFLDEPLKADIIVLKKKVAGQLVKVKELNLSEIEVSELKIIKSNGKPDKKPLKENGKRGYVDDDYQEETGMETLLQLPENVEISLEYSTSLELVFMRSGQTIRLHSLVINNTEILN